MDWKTFAVVLFAMAGSYLILSLPVAFATDVSIYFNNQLMGSAQISPQNMVNKQVVISHQESDVTWSNTKVMVRVSTASLAQSVKKIYVYKCRKLDPNACMQTIPQSWDSWVDTEFAWSDISEQQGQSSYPQVANILVLVKLEGANSRTSWMAFWDTVKRIDYNVFNDYTYEIGGIDVYAKSADLVSPIQSYISNFQMVPFNWVSKAVFSSASVLYGGGGNSMELNKPQPDLETAQTTNQITTINKDFYFIFSNISSGVTNALTINLNPSFTCGDNKCETDLGESMASCCYDCDCPSGSYCDIAGATAADKTGACKRSNLTALSVTGYSVPTPLQQCNAPVAVNVTAKIDNPPSNLPANINGLFRINSTQYPVACAGSAGIYNCPLRVQAPVSCGFGSFSLGPNMLNMSISYRDGANMVFKDLSATFPSINVNYDCSCPANFYCDIGPKVCRSEGSIMLQVLSVNSYLNNFTGANDLVKMVFRIINTPTNFSVDSFDVLFGNITWGASSAPAGSSTVSEGAGCVRADATANYIIYNCTPTLTIPNYNPNETYVVRLNRVNATVSYTDGGVQKQRVLAAGFGDITVPQQSCGNGRIDPRETQSNCCRDAGCPSVGQFCDIQNGCQYVGNISAAVLNVDPSNVSDCIIPHMINLTVRINNAPSDARLNYNSYLRNGLTQAWSVQCSQPAYMTGIVTCSLVMPPQTNCSLPFSRIDGNSINLSISFRNGDREVVSREMNAPFGDLLIVPAWHCGNRACESDIGESAANCCIDCPCGTSGLFGNNSADYYCNYDPQNIANGSCEARSNITLRIDRPTAPVTFKSCEYTNTINIKAHVENQPASMKLENFFGTFNGQSAEVGCEQGGVLPSASYIGGWSCVGTTYSGMWSCIGVNCSQYTSQSACTNVAGCSWTQSSAASSCSQYTSQSTCTANAGCAWQPAANLLTAFNINCTMVVPAEPECTQGRTYTYTNNSLGVFVSFRDGLGRVITQTLISAIADASITQSYRTLYDITQDAVKKMQDNVQKSLDLARKLMDWIKICITMSIVLAIAQIGFTVYVAATAGGPTTTVTKDASGKVTKTVTTGEGMKFMDRVGTDRWKNAVAAAGASATAINTIWGNICNLISLYFQAAQKSLEIEAEMLKMDVCIQVYQHMLDAGQCVTMGLDSCFSGLRSCVNYGAVNSAMGQMNSIMGQANAATLNIGNAISQWGTAMGRLGWGSNNAVLSISINGLPLTQDPSTGKSVACNRYQLGGAPSGVDPTDTLTVNVIKGTSGCDYPVVLYGPATGTISQLTKSTGTTSFPVKIDSIPTEQNWQFNLYCFNSASDFINNQNSLLRGIDVKAGADTSGKVAPADYVDVTIKVDQYGGTCGLGTGATSTGEILTTQFIMGIQQRITTVINQLPTGETAARGAFQAAISSLDAANRASSINDKKTNANSAVASLRQVTSMTGVTGMATNDFAGRIQNPTTQIINDLNTEIGRTPSSTPATPAGDTGGGSADIGTGSTLPAGVTGCCNTGTASSPSCYNTYDNGDGCKNNYGADAFIPNKQCTNNECI